MTTLLKNIVHTRGLTTKTALVRTVATSVMNCEDVQIPVAWGHIAGKWWGPKDRKPILSLHGWQDNSGTFDTLIPKLPTTHSYLAIDFPGHGLSSRLPPGMFYYGSNGSILIRQLQEYFKWDKVSLMGHSMGAITSYSFGMLYPEKVDFIICFDGLTTLLNVKGLNNVVRAIEGFLKYDKQSQGSGHAPCYSIEQMKNLLHTATHKSVDLDKCHYILERNIAPCAEHPGQYYFNRDPRLKCGPIVSFTREELFEGAKRVNFPLLLARPLKRSPFFTKAHAEYINKVLEELLQHNPQFEIHDFEGTHHGHLNTPDMFVDMITNFLKKYDHSDRAIHHLPEEIFVKLENRVDIK